MTLHSGWKAVWQNGINQQKDYACQNTYSITADIGGKEEERFDKNCVVPSEDMLQQREWLKNAP